MFEATSSTHQLARLRAQTPDRLARVHKLGLFSEPDAEFDRFASALARESGTDEAMAMVNFLGDRQYFAGLWVPPSARVDGAVAMSRVMSLEHGWCPEVVDRGKALPLYDVCLSPRFRTNEVANEFGIRTYMGAPLFDPEDPTLPIGTVCVIGTQPRPKEEGGQMLTYIKERAQQAQFLLNRRVHDLL
ncbi:MULTISPECIES: GAF domain-containing protein [Streptomyces]|uniref:GAF domain-containing protein n=1 Tax=Streptomyces TaxID=1883 RepID=UPI0029AABC00|nr:GAF domain-containing protein [Streptomyces stelliscabiei]MDX3435607.1 GAF domain-containing protein [Streptomyces stelliscabiei]MDX3622094.1 GAF domain-containing protein [Streptomyces stelliscabiei]